MTQPHLTIVDHPLVQHKLTLMRDKATSTAGFRRLLREISLLLAYEITRELEMTTTRIETPLCEMDAPMLEGKKLALISILRAGNGLLDGILELILAALESPVIGCRNIALNTLDAWRKADYPLTPVLQEELARLREIEPDEKTKKRLEGF